MIPLAGTARPPLGPAITRAASSQTYYTIRLLVDRSRVADAYRAYAYFRWVDDILDAEGQPGSASQTTEQLERVRFLDRQRSLLNRCLGGETPRDVNDHEAMLVDLAGHDDRSSDGLEAYLRNMMLVMEFDIRRRGRLVSQGELDDYTHWLAIAVTEAMHHFIGNGAASPHDDTRYLAVSGAHILHMLRDTYSDIQAGYYNVPAEVLEANSIGPEDVGTEAYRAWVRARVQLAREYLDVGAGFFARVENVRHRLAGLAYIARFEWLIETLERDGFRVRPEYAERNSVTTGLRLGLHLLPAAFGVRANRSTSRSMPASDGSHL